MSRKGVYIWSGSVILCLVPSRIAGARRDVKSGMV